MAMLDILLCHAQQHIRQLHSPALPNLFSAMLVRSKVLQLSNVLLCHARQLQLFFFKKKIKVGYEYDKFQYTAGE
jgi:hypothetical protein